jgi:divalent metal cation (Fe/Co/Zn/Cd) transporter
MATPTTSSPNTSPLLRAVWAVILATHGWYWLDPAVALVIAAVIGYHARMLIRRVLVAIKT